MLLLIFLTVFISAGLAVWVAARPRQSVVSAGCLAPARVTSPRRAGCEATFFVVSSHRRLSQPGAAPHR